MSSSSSDSENDQNDSDYNFYPGNIFEAEEGAVGVVGENVVSEHDMLSDSDQPYHDEPLADEGWLAQYNREISENEERERQLGRRLTGSEPIEAW